ncbi:MAG: hypothetical protein LC774_02920 [Acidobacteria bacterium]|nr:hypothetical protein [Acidobacteriota bacterium]
MIRSKTPNARTGSRLVSARAAALAAFATLTTCLASSPGAFARQPQDPQPSQPQQRITQAQAELYERWRSNINTNQPVAFDAGSAYLARYPGDEYAAHVRRWVDAYERAFRKVEFQRFFKTQRFAELFRTGKVILADEPGQLKIIFHLAYAGYLAAGGGDDSFAAESLEYARRAAQLIESGAKPTDWQPFADKSDALGYLHFVIGELTFKDDPAGSARLFRKALGFETTLRRTPVIYSRLAATYVASEYDPLSKDYTSRFAGKDPTDESRAALEKINAVVDRVLDAYARAVSFSGEDPKYADAKRRWSEELTRFYKFRHDDLFVPPSAFPVFNLQSRR